MGSTPSNRGQFTGMTHPTNIVHLAGHWCETGERSLEMTVLTDDGTVSVYLTPEEVKKFRDAFDRWATRLES